MNGNPAKDFVLEALDIEKSFGVTNVLRKANLRVAPREIDALLGGNGAGKSTFIRIVSGSLGRDAGVISVGGRKDYNPGEIAVVFQELALLPDLSVAENIHLPHRHDALGRIDTRKMGALAAEALAMIDPALVLSLHRPVSSLDLHKRQLVEIARALSSGAKLILLDEPTANLSFADAERLFTILRRLTDLGISILLVSHRISEIRAIADVCTILRDGRSVVDRRALAEISDEEIIQAMMGDVREKVETITEARKRGRRALPGPRQRQSRPGLPAGSILGLAGAPDGPAGVINALIGADPRPPGRSRWTVNPGDSARRPRPCEAGWAMSPEIELRRASSRRCRFSTIWRPPDASRASNGWCCRRKFGKRPRAATPLDQGEFTRRSAANAVRRHSAEIADRALAGPGAEDPRARRADARRRYRDQARDLPDHSHRGRRRNDRRVVVDRILRTRRDLRSRHHLRSAGRGQRTLEREDITEVAMARATGMAA